MVELLHPGIYVQETKGIPPIEGVSTSVAGFIGVARKGVLNQPVLVSNWTQFVENFGGFMENSYLAYAVRQFFENGGNRAYIVRIAHYDSNIGGYTATASTGQINDTGGVNPLISITAKNEGEWGDDISVEVVEVDAVDKNITLKIYDKDNLVEVYEKVPFSELEDTINRGSKFINILVPTSDLTNITIGKVKLSGGNDGLENLEDDDFIGDEAKGTGIYAFNNVDVNMIAIPGITSIPVQSALVSYVEKRENCIAILDSPLGHNVSELINYIEEYENVLASSYAVMYYPWIIANDPIGIGKSPTKLLPPSGAIAGIYARIDNSRGVHKAPAGIEATILGAIDLEYNVTDSDQDLLNPLGVNCIRVFSGRGIVLWGARTLSRDVDYRYINVRRHVIKVKEALKKNLDWVVFEPNDEVLWGKITTVVSDYLRSEWRAGALKGTEESEAFYVKCDDEINTQETIDLGQVFVDVGLAEQKPAEFVVFRISLKK